MILRLCKIALVASAALFLIIVVLNNTVFDYASNYAFVQHVLAMDSLFSGENQSWRALRDPTPEDGSWWFYHVFYASIILWEAVAGEICTVGAWKLWQARSATAAAFQKAKALAALGLVVSMLQWFVAFITVGGEWFLMWQSSTWNGQTAAFRMFACLGLMLVFLMQPDEEP
jgi:predicted small integral membrane protein